MSMNVREPLSKEQVEAIRLGTATWPRSAHFEAWCEVQAGRELLRISLGWVAEFTSKIIARLQAALGSL